MGVYPGSDKEGPTSSGGEYYISLHLSACVGVTSYERGNRSQVSRKEYNGVLLEMLISEVEKMSIFVVLCLENPLPSLFIESSEGRGVPKTLRRCHRGEGLVGAVEVAVATCPGNGRPYLGYRADIDDGTVKGPRSYGERAIPCGRRTGIVPLLTDGT
jgi:hypothetical protein